MEWQLGLTPLGILDELTNAIIKIIEDVIVLKFSRIVKDNDGDPTPAVSNDNINALAQVAQELVGDSVVVELERA